MVTEPLKIAMVGGLYRWETKTKKYGFEPINIWGFPS